MVICLASSSTTVAPIGADKVKLQESGLGEKCLQFPSDASAEVMHEIVLEAFPGLTATGYEFLRTTGSGKKDLEDVGNISGVASLRTAFGQAKCYVRPIVGELSLVKTENISELHSAKACLCVEYLW